LRQPDNIRNNSISFQVNILKNIFHTNNSRSKTLKNKNVMNDQDRMTPLELKSSASLASIYGLRMFGMFSILPILAIYASGLPSRPNSALIGWAFGAFPLAQAIFQLPFGMASDKFGRKNLIYLGLIVFAIGSFIAASAHSIEMIIFGRAVQGAGAVSAAVMALVADSTREEHRTKAMAMIGSTIGVTFALSLIAGPVLNRLIGVPGIFMMTGMLALLAVLVVKFVVPNPAVSMFHSDAEASQARLKEVLNNTQLLRLNFGIFALHAAQMALFIVVPFAIKATGMSENDHWKIYLPVLVTSFVLMVPAIIYAEKRAKMKLVFISAIALMVLAQLMFADLIGSFWGIVISLTAYFIAFNTLEASLPSLISKMAPAATKGTAMGVYNTCQSLGAALGGVVGGYLLHHYGNAAVFVFCSALMCVWLVLSFGMKAPPSVKTKMYHVEGLTESQAIELAAQVGKMLGVQEAVAIAKENTLIVKINNQQSKEAQVAVEQNILKLIGSR